MTASGLEGRAGFPGAPGASGGRESHVGALQVKDVMHAGVVSCSPETSLEEVAQMMREQRISAVVVVADGVAVGVLSQTDLVNTAYVQPYLRHWRGLNARHVMNAPVIAVRPDTPLAQAIDILRKRGIHRVVVTEPSSRGECPVGILSVSDVARLLEMPIVAAIEKERA